MLNGNIYYHGIIRKTIVAFGRLFSNIYIERKEGDSVTGNTIQTLQIPLTYAPKEKWLVRLEQDPTLENQTYTSLPRMSFEITNYSYDASRKMARMNQIVCQGEGSANRVFTPVPYNVNVSLYVLTKTQEDALQIIEQILPTFTPEYTLAVSVIPDMNVIQDIPISLDSIQVNDEYDGDFQTRRFVTYTLDFTLKLNLFGPVKLGTPIYQSEANIGTQNNNVTQVQYQANADPVTKEITEHWDIEL